LVSVAIENLHEPEKSAFIRFSDDRWLFFLLTVTLFVVSFVLVIILLRVLRRQAVGSDKTWVDGPSGALFRDV
jgi:hypothetical protein